MSYWILKPVKTAITPNSVIISASLASYFVFHRYEPQSPLSLLFLLLLIPVAVSQFFRLEITAAVSIFCSHWCLLLLFTIGYRISPFHPLAKYPGPFRYRISKFQVTWNLWNQNLHRDIRELHLSYGDIVRIGPNELSYAKVDGVGSILNSLTKGAYYLDRQQVPSMFEIPDPAFHARRRKPWTRCFNGPSLKDFDPVIIKRTRELVGEMQKRRATPIDLSKWMNYFSFDFMGDIVFSFSFGSMEEGRDVQGYMQAVTTTVKTIALVSHIPWSTKVVMTHSGIGLDVYRMSQALIGHRMKAGSMARDLIYHLSNEDGKQSGEAPEPIQLFADGVTAIVAGSDTTSTVLTNVWYYLLRTPTYYARLHEEVDANFPAGEEPFDQETLAGMPFLNACINESLRLQPAVPGGSQRVVSTGGSLVGPHFIPEGTAISLHTYTIQRDPRYFSPHPDDFWPDRWLEPESRRSLGDITQNITSAERAKFVMDQTAFVAFSSGSRNCVGKNLAMNEMRAVVSVIVQRFDMEVAPGYNLDNWEGNLSDWFVLMKRGDLPVILKERV